MTVVVSGEAGSGYPDATTPSKETGMSESGKTQEMGGRAKEAMGALRGDEEQKDEGRQDQREGKARQAGEKLREAAEDVKDALRR